MSRLTCRCALGLAFVMGCSLGGPAASAPGDVMDAAKTDSPADATPDASLPDPFDSAPGDAAGVDVADAAPDPTLEAAADLPVDVAGCPVGTQDCDGDSIRLCIAGEWRVQPPCQHGCLFGHCNSCRPGTPECDGNKARVCRADGMGWEVLADCEIGCRDGACCQPDCSARNCGDDACVATCGACQDWQSCNEDGRCFPECDLPRQPPICWSDSELADCVDGWWAVSTCEMGCVQDSPPYCRECADGFYRCSSLGGGSLVQRCHLGRWEKTYGPCNSCQCTTLGGVVALECSPLVGALLKFPIDCGGACPADDKGCAPGG